MLDGWEALANVAKYLRRQSVLEALEQLSRARERVLQLWAVAEQVPYPAFGLVSLLDNPAASLPPAIEVTYAGASADDVRTAALTTAELLGMAADCAQPGLATALRPYVIRHLHGPADSLRAPLGLARRNEPGVLCRAVGCRQFLAGACSRPGSLDAGVKSSRIRVDSQGDRT